jgi:hypothetical protein
MQPTKTSSSDRIAALERKMKRMIACMIVLPAFAFLLGAAANDMIRAKSVTTEKLVIVDSGGNERAALFCGDQDEPVLEMYNADHSLMLNAAKSPDNGVGFVQFFDAAGKFKGGVGGNSLK